MDILCQGIYLNTVGGQQRLTAHFQLDISRTKASQLLIPVDGMRLDFVYPDAGQAGEGSSPGAAPALDGGESLPPLEADGEDVGSAVTSRQAGPEHPRDFRLTPREVWSRRHQAHQSVLVNPWSNKSLDVFFDLEDIEAPLPSILRLRLRAESEGGWVHVDCQFARIYEDEGEEPAGLPTSDKQFGVRNGYYFPGYGALGKRGLRDSVEARRHYLFHAP